MRSRQRRRQATSRQADGARVPVRTCVGCRRTAPATELVRIFRDADGMLSVGPGPGRGAWLCPPPAAFDCLDVAVKRRALERALRTTLGGDAVPRIRAKLETMSG